MTLPQIYATVRKRRGRAKILASVIVGTYFFSRPNWGSALHLLYVLCQPFTQGVSR